MKIALGMILILGLVVQVEGAKRPRRRRLPKTKTEQVKKSPQTQKSTTAEKSGQTCGTSVSLSKVDSLLAAGDSATAAEVIARYASTAQSVDSSQVDRIIWALDYLARTGKDTEALAGAKHLTELDSTFAPYEEILQAQVWASRGKTGYAYFLARKAEHLCAGTRWEKTVRELGEQLRRQIFDITKQPNASKTNTTASPGKSQGKVSENK